jgi:hypothetical protein
MLNFELKRHKPAEHIIERLTDISRIKKVAEKFSDSRVLGEALLLLSLTELKESVEIIFKLLRRLNEKEYHEVESAFEMALFGVDSRLYDKHHVSINDKLYELIADEDPILRDRGMKLHKRKMKWRR